MQAALLETKSAVLFPELKEPQHWAIPGLSSRVHSLFPTCCLSLELAGETDTRIFMCYRFRHSANRPATRDGDNKFMEDTVNKSLQDVSHCGACVLCLCFWQEGKDSINISITQRKERGRKGGQSCCIAFRGRRGSREALYDNPQQQNGTTIYSRCQLLSTAKWNKLNTGAWSFSLSVKFRTKLYAAVSEERIFITESGQEGPSLHSFVWSPRGRVYFASFRKKENTAEQTLTSSNQIGWAFHLIVSASLHRAVK